MAPTPELFLRNFYCSVGNGITSSAVPFIHFLVHLSVYPDRYCYYDISWTAWTVGWNWQGIFTSPCWWPD